MASRLDQKVLVSFYGEKKSIEHFKPIHKVIMLKKNSHNIVGIFPQCPAVSVKNPVDKIDAAL